MPMIFMAGGSGLSSPRSMILDLLEEGCALPLTLIYGQRTIEELYYHGEFVALAAKHPNFTYLPVLSHEPESGAWAGERGFVHEMAHRHFRSEEHTSELQSLMRISYAVFCLKKKKQT